MLGGRAPCDSRAATNSIGAMRSDSGSGAHLYNLAVFANIREAAPPPIETYGHWLSGQRNGRAGHGLPTMTAAKLRRLVVMRRGGQPFSDIASAVGLSVNCVKGWLIRLPEELAP